MNMLTQHVTGGTGDVGDDRRFTARRGVEQARFTGVRAARNHDLHPLAQQATLTCFGTHRVEIGHHAIELSFNFTVREEVDLLIREIDSRFDIDAQVSKCFHKMIHAH